MKKWGRKNWGGRRKRGEDRLKIDSLLVLWYFAGICYGLQRAVSSAGGGSY